MCMYFLNKTTDGFRNNQNVMSNLTMSMEQSVLENQYPKFKEEFGSYMIEDLGRIVFESSLNYLPIRDFVIATSMLDNDELYNQLSNNPNWNWKEKLLSKEEQHKHMCIMFNKLQHDCWDWFEQQTELENEMKLEYKDDEYLPLLSMMFIEIIENKVVGDYFRK